MADNLTAAERLDLGRRALAAGMRWEGRMWAIQRRADLTRIRAERPCMDPEGMSETWVPDLADPMTRGALLEQVRERLGPGGGSAVARHIGQQVIDGQAAPEWRLWDGPTPPWSYSAYTSEAACLVAALERAGSEPCGLQPWSSNCEDGGGSHVCGSPAGHDGLCACARCGAVGLRRRAP